MDRPVQHPKDDAADAAAVQMLQQQQMKISPSLFKT
jgi:hypothetical protein